MCASRRVARCIGARIEAEKRTTANYAGEIPMLKYSKLVLVSFSVACLIAVLTCLIVNFAIDRQITWAAYALLSVPFGWLVLSPLVIKKFGSALALLSLTLFVLPFLFVLDRITPVDSWFVPLGIPSAVAGVIAVWIFFLLFRFVKINNWYKSAITVFVTGVVVNPVVNYYVDRFVIDQSSLLSTILTATGCLILAIALFIVGHKRSKADSAMRNAEA